MAKTKAAAKADNDQQRSNQNDKPSKHYQEWEVKITRTPEGPVAEKLKVLRPVVKITDEQAETLNAGRLEGGNTYTQMYYLPE